MYRIYELRRDKYVAIGPPMDYATAVRLIKYMCSVDRAYHAYDVRPVQ